MFSRRLRRFCVIRRLDLHSRRVRLRSDRHIPRRRLSDFCFRFTISLFLNIFGDDARSKPKPLNESSTFFTAVEVSHTRLVRSIEGGTDYLFDLSVVFQYSLSDER